MTKQPGKRTAGSCLWLALAFALPWGSTAAQPPPAEERIHRAMAAALDHDPGLAIRARAEAERGALEAESLPAGPALEWQTEGLGSGAEREPNAADSLRLRKELGLFGQRSSARAFRRQAGEALDGAQRVALLELAAAVGREWLELAAALERRALVAHRLERLDRSVALHRKRLELGEVAGTEVRQLELERARDGAQLTALDLQADELAGRLRRRAGDVPLPAPGDLVALASDLRPLPDIGALAASASPFHRAAAARRLAAEHRLELIRRTAWGRPEAEAEIQRIPGVAGEPSFETFGFRLAVPLPAGKQGRARRAAAEAEMEAARAEAASAGQELQRRLDMALSRVRSSEELLSVLASVAKGLPFTERSLAEQFRLGAISYLVYIDGLLRLDELRQDLVGARLTLLTSRLDLAMLLANAEIFPIPAIPFPTVNEDPANEETPS